MPLGKRKKSVKSPPTSQKGVNRKSMSMEGSCSGPAGNSDDWINSASCKCSRQTNPQDGLPFARREALLPPSFLVFIFLRKFSPFLRSAEERHLISERPFLTVSAAPPMLWPGGIHARQPLLGRLDRAVLQKSPTSCQPLLPHRRHPADHALTALLSRDRLCAPGVAGRRRTVCNWMDLSVRRPRL